MVVAIIIFALTYVGISGQLPFLHLDRPGVALTGAVAMVACGVLPIEMAFAAVNLDTLGLLLGMMIIAAYLSEAAFFRFTAWWVLSKMQSARSLLWALVFVTGGLSAILVNDTVCLMFAPLVIAVVREAKLPPLPYLLALATGANLGGVVTYTGNPQNMLVGMAAHGHPGYVTYFLLALPVGILCLVVDATLLTWMFRRVLPRGPISERHTPRPPLDHVLAWKGLGALGLFVVLAVLGKSLAGAALTSAALLMVVSGSSPKKAIARVDWPLLLFFGALFVVVGGLAHSGALQKIPVPHDQNALALLTVTGSNLVSNVPFVLVAMHWIPTLPHPFWGYVYLAVASTLAGNLTLMGSVANIIVFESAGGDGGIGFLRFLKHGVIITLATLATAFAVLSIEQTFMS